MAYNKAVSLVVMLNHAGSVCSQNLPVKEAVGDPCNAILLWSPRDCNELFLRMFAATLILSSSFELPLISCMGVNECACSKALIALKAWSRRC